MLTGVALLFAPAIVIGLLLGDGLGPTGVAAARVFGIGLLGLGIAAWQFERPDFNAAPRIGICTYNLGVAGLLSMLGAVGQSDGTSLAGCRIARIDRCDDAFGLDGLVTED